jgi:hypothetical protein
VGQQHATAGLCFRHHLQFILNYCHKNLAAAAGECAQYVQLPHKILHSQLGHEGGFARIVCSNSCMRDEKGSLATKSHGAWGSRVQVPSLGPMRKAA